MMTNTTQIGQSEVADNIHKALSREEDHIADLDDVISALENDLACVVLPPHPLTQGSDPQQKEESPSDIRGRINEHVSKQRSLYNRLRNLRERLDL